MKTDPKKYFEKNGFIYGDSWKYDFGSYHHNVKKFTDYNKAIEWLNTEEYDFRTREFITKSEAINLGWVESEDGRW